MSVFYQAMALDPEADMQFKAMKREFKRGQSCKNCRRKLRPHLMTVDHIIPVRDPSVNPFDMLNWQVLCMPCHREKNRREIAQMNQEQHNLIKQGVHHVQPIQAQDIRAEDSQGKAAISTP